MKAELEKLLHELVGLTGINCVVQGEQSVAELFFNRPGQTQLSFLDGWGTFESEDFHIHFKSTDLTGARFMDVEGSCVERATYVMILDNGGQERLRFYFANPSDDSRPYTPAEVAHFERLRTAYSQLW